MTSRPMSNIDKHSLAIDESVKTYYIHPAAFGSTKNPGYGHVPVVHADDFEKQRAKLEAAEKRIAELEAKKVTIKLPKSFYPDADIDRPLVINEYQIIEAIVAADCKPIAVCPRCKRELDLTHKPDGAHYCHVADTAEGE